MVTTLNLKRQFWVVRRGLKLRHCLEFVDIVSWERIHWGGRGCACFCLKLKLGQGVIG